MSMELLKNKKNVEFFKQEESLYDKFKDSIERYCLLDGLQNVVFLFSGGKDATFGLYFLNKYIQENSLPINLCAILVTYPRHVYYEESGKEASCFKNTKDFWNKQSVVVEVFESDEQDLKEGVIEGCKICKSARKKLVDKYIKNLAKTGKTAIVTGYTLYDVLAYMDEYCLTTNFNFDLSSYEDEMVVGRIKNCLHKMKIKEELPNGFRIIRPLIVFKENEILKFIKENGIPYTSRPCKVSSLKHKRAYFGVLNLVNHINNTSYEGVLSFLEKHNVELPESFEDIHYDNYFTDC